MKSLSIIILVAFSGMLTAEPLDFQFKSPSFNGNGYSAHVLTIENQEHSRKEAIKDKIQSELDKAKRETEDTNLNKFLNNLESRIYAQISQDLATAMFASDGSAPSSGTLNFEGNVIYWNKSSTEISLQVTDLTGTTTTIGIPLGDFNF
jgi:hypothetical protein